MSDLTVRQILDLATAEVPDGSDHIKKVYEWQFERGMTAVRLILGAAGSLVLALVAAILTKDADVQAWQILVIGGSAALIASFGLARFQAARRIQVEYLAALQLLRQVEQLAALLRLYRQRYGEG